MSEEGAGLRIRAARVEDLGEIVALLADDGRGRRRERPGDPAYAAGFAAMQSQPGNLFLVAERDGRLLGCLQFTRIHGLSRRGATRVQIEAVRVAPAARGGGIGTALFEAAFARARAEGAALVQLTSDARRDRARRFYERLGFDATHLGFKREL